MEVKIYNQKGEESGKIKLPESIFNVSWNSNLVHQTAVSLMSNKRRGTAHAKDRSEVSGGGKKPWRQKGTGRARHGSTRSPIWVGGGVTHGPRKEKNYSTKINKKVKSKALYSVLSKKLKEGEILFVDDIKITDPKTKSAKEILNSLSKIDGFDKLNSKKRNTAFLALDGKKESVLKSFRNFGNVGTDESRNLSILPLLQYKYLIISNPEVSLKKLPGMPVKKD